MNRDEHLNAIMAKCRANIGWRSSAKVSDAGLVATAEIIAVLRPLAERDNEDYDGANHGDAPASARDRGQSALASTLLDTIIAAWLEELP